MKRIARRRYRRAFAALAAACVRGRFDGRALVEVADIFVGDSRGPGNAGGASRLAWGTDGTLFMTMGGAGAVAPDDGAVFRIAPAN